MVNVQSIYKLMKTIKTSLQAIVSLLTLSGALALAPTGCAGTSTHESTGEYVDDSTVTAKVKAALVKDDTVKAREIQVETFKGVVQLSGFVDNGEQKSRAAEIAGGIPGVRSVKNNIAVKTNQ
jgi:hyperosmotically inducible periplasmic protein